jgi:hypothetical protein
MYRLHRRRGLAALVAVVCVCGCEVAKSANPAAPSAIDRVGGAASSAPPAVMSSARIDAPAAMAPAGRLNTNNPDFFVLNGAIAGANNVAYVFEVSKTGDFSQIAAAVTVPVNPTGTTMMSLGSIAYGQTLYWRAKGTDGSTESDFSATLTFTTPSGPDAASSGDPVASIESASWTNDRWRAFFFALAAEKGVGIVSDEGMRAMRDDLVARGADFQNGWRGDYRPRLFLPVPGCPIANRPDVPACSYSRTVDMGRYGREWEWVIR